jgi:glutaminyl-tRNA synthetase
MPTLAGLRRRGYTPESIRAFCETIGVGRSDSWIDMSILEESVRQDLNEKSPRAMAVLRPLRLVIENYPVGGAEEFEVANHPQKPELGTRNVPFSRELFIESDDFAEVPPKGFKRLFPGQEVRLRNAYIIKCTGFEKDDSGNVTEVRCSYDPDTRSGLPGADRKVKGVIHWVSASHAMTAEVRLYDRLFTVPNPGGEQWKEQINPASVEVLVNCRLEPSLAALPTEVRVQFERNGYFCEDYKESRPGHPVFNRTVTLRDSWAKSSR